MRVILFSGLHQTAASPNATQVHRGIPRSPAVKERRSDRHGHQDGDNEGTDSTSEELQVTPRAAVQAYRSFRVADSSQLLPTVSFVTRGP